MESFRTGSAGGRGARRGTRRRGRTAAGAVVCALAALALTGAAPATETGQTAGRTAEKGAATAFRAADSPGRGGGPGSVLSAEPTSFQSWPGVPTDTFAWKITYRSTSADGRPNAVSGTVLVPHDGRDGTRPLVTYAVGTVGMGDQCAPSSGFPDGTTTEAPLINAALVRGYAVAVTDYEGLGTPGDHTYTVARAEATAVLDAARAAQRLPGARGLGVGPRSPVGIMGYSQGGQASAKAAEIAAWYAPELDVRGTASGGVPADLTQVAEASDGGDNAGFVLMSAIGHDAAFPGLHLGTYLNDKGRRLTARARDACASEILEAAAGTRMDELTVTNPLRRPDWRVRLAADTLGKRAPAAPTFVYHGEADEVVPYAQGQGLRARWCARGNAVGFRSFPGSDHVGTAVAGNAPALAWLGDRFAGEPAPDDCPA
ncbi:lipase family protein [Streptomyces tubbatahanensis]|uniref:Lipase family protein n=1 Tax=Streptomyces tubbatahanensis TaxID=2923272 RepID=A0ABY3XVE7_9ACTN|nr:lipase family protein [Streptomyces tubbatahanensis]UNS98328.1 lipase family protein [Streptomyces tubbatahanensis]